MTANQASRDISPPFVTFFKNLMLVSFWHGYREVETGGGTRGGSRGRTSMSPPYITVKMVCMCLHVNSVFVCVCARVACLHILVCVHELLLCKG